MLILLYLTYLCYNSHAKLNHRVIGVGKSDDDFHSCVIRLHYVMLRNNLKTIYLAYI